MKACDHCGAQGPTELRVSVEPMEYRSERWNFHSTIDLCDKCRSLLEKKLGQVLASIRKAKVTVPT